MGSALQEIEESLYWLELMTEAHVMPAPKLESLIRETEELISVFTSSVKTAKRRGKD